jgi:hypothetical protein
VRLVDHLDPSERLGELIFGLIMLLTFTLGAGLAVSEGREGVRELLLAALGCNLAWGLIDGVLYVMNQLLERGRLTRLVRAVQQAEDRAAALEVIRGELDPTLAGFTSPEARARLYGDAFAGVSQMTLEPVRLRMIDVYGGLASFLLVFVGTVPAVVPFVFLSDPHLALRISNALLIGMLYLAGHRWARHSGGSELGTGLATMSIGVVLVGVAMALGG